MATPNAPLGTQGTHVHEAKQGNTNRTEDTAEEANTNATTMEATTEATKTKSTNRTAQKPTKATKHTADSATVDFRRNAEEALRSYTKPTRAAGTQHTPEVKSTRDTTNTMAIEAEGLLKQWLVAHCQQRRSASPTKPIHHLQQSWCHSHANATNARVKRDANYQDVDRRRTWGSRTPTNPSPAMYRGTQQGTTKTLTLKRRRTAKKAP